MVMTLPTATAIAGAIGAAIILVLVLARRRFGELNVASWLVIFGAVVLVPEHPHWATAGAALSPYEVSDDLRLALVEHPHTRLHFLMASIFAFISLVLLVIIARTLLKEGRRAGWFAVLIALVLGATFDLVTGSLWYPKGFPLFALVGRDTSGWGWQWLYLYVAAWIAALAVSYRPIFRSHSARTGHRP